MTASARVFWVISAIAAGFAGRDRAWAQGVGSHPIPVFEQTPLTNGMSFNGFLIDSTQAMFRRDALVMSDSAFAGLMLGGSLPVAADLRSFSVSAAVQPSKRLSFKGGYQSNSIGYTPELSTFAAGGSNRLAYSSFYGAALLTIRAGLPLTFNLSIASTKVANAGEFEEKFAHLNFGISSQLGKLKLGFSVLNANKAIVKGTYIGNNSNGDSLALPLYRPGNVYEYQIEPLYLFPVAYTFTGRAVSAVVEVVPQASFGEGFKAYNSFPVTVEVGTRFGLYVSATYRYVSSNSERSYLPQQGWAGSVRYSKKSIAVGYALSKTSFFRTILNHQVFLTYQIYRR